MGEEEGRGEGVGEVAFNVCEDLIRSQLSFFGTIKYLCSPLTAIKSLNREALSTLLLALGAVAAVVDISVVRYGEFLTEHL